MFTGYETGFSGVRLYIILCPTRTDELFLSLYGWSKLVVEHIDVSFPVPILETSWCYGLYWKSFLYFLVHF